MFDRPQCHRCGRFMSDHDLQMGDHREVWATGTTPELERVDHYHALCSALEMRERHERLLAKTGISPALKRAIKDIKNGKTKGFQHNGQ